MHSHRGKCDLFYKCEIEGEPTHLANLLRFSVHVPRIADLFSILNTWQAQTWTEPNQIKSEKNTTTDIYFVSNIMDEWVKIGSVVKSLSAWWYHESWAFNMKYMNIIFELPSNRDVLKRKLQKKRSKINKKNRIVTEKERKNKTENRNSNCEKKI